MIDGMDGMDLQRQLMRRALRLAVRGSGRVAPNPLVGAVVANRGKIVGEGYHLYSKTDHAEIIAIRQAGDQARGAELYVNLEPCSHFGRTPPCVEAILLAGIKKVYVAVRDPNPLVAGAGIARLAEHGVEVQEGLCAQQAVKLNEKFFHFIQKRKPFVLLKLALSLDGRIATRTGDSRWITGPEARKLVHRLRFEYDAILVGSRTILTDDPSLDVRSRRRTDITKIVLDPRLETPGNARIFESGDRVVLVHGPEAAPHPAWAGRAALISAPTGEGGFDWEFLLTRLAAEGVTSIIIEGGGATAASALQAGIVQKIAFFYAPILLGNQGVPGVGDLCVDRLQDALRLKDMRLRRLGPDLLVTAYL
jgi:diaminohydroxyphosphoribosylaminopyrimidine deaminase / 5-amino-6-(5-phosphoribosylamino)uracil reductase